VEFSVLGVLGFGFLVQVVVFFGIVHRATLATSAAARELGRVVVLGDSDADAERLGRAAVEQAGRNHGLAPGALRPSLDGRVARGAQLRVTVSTDVEVIRLPFIGSVLPSLSLPVEATHVVQVDRYRSFSKAKR
jgi:hypothetical protein